MLQKYSYAAGGQVEVFICFVGQQGNRQRQRSKNRNERYCDTVDSQICCSNKPVRSLALPRFQDIENILTRCYLCSTCVPMHTESQHN